MWPHLIWAIFLLIIIFTFKHRIDEILNSFGKKGKVRYGSFNIELGSDIPSLATTQQDSPDAKHLALQKTYQSSLITNEEIIIRNQLMEAKLSPEQTVNVLIYHLAHANLVVKLLAIDKLIFPEQIELLLYLNSKFKPAPESELLSFYTKWKGKNPQIDYPFRGFLDYLLNQRLIFQNIEGLNIAPIGKEYLGFLIKTSRQLTPTNHPGGKN
jgi:hypothetical protein